MCVAYGQLHPRVCVCTCEYVCYLLGNGQLPSMTTILGWKFHSAVVLSAAACMAVSMQQPWSNCIYLLKQIPFGEFNTPSELIVLSSLWFQTDGTSVLVFILRLLKHMNRRANQ